MRNWPSAPVRRTVRPSSSKATVNRSTGMSSGFRLRAETRTAAPATGRPAGSFTRPKSATAFSGLIVRSIVPLLDGTDTGAAVVASPRAAER